MLKSYYNMESYSLLKTGFASFLLLLLLAISTSCSILVGPRQDGRSPLLKRFKPVFSRSDKVIGRHDSTYDVHFYDLSLEINPDTRMIAGEVDIHFKTLDGIKDRIRIDLHKSFRITSVALNDEPVTYERKANSFYIKYPYQPGQYYRLKVAYDGSPKVSGDPPWDEGFVWKRDGKGKPWVGVVCQSKGAHIWWPVKDDTMDEPDSARIRLTVPKGIKGVSNGRLVDSGNIGKKDYYTWFVRNPINVYNITAYLGDYRKIEIPFTSVNGNTYDLEFYALAGNFDRARKHFQQTVQVMECFENYFGEYPWWEDGFKMVESPYEGMEHQTAIAYGNGYYNYGSIGDYIIVHEAAHEWWGNSVTASDYRHIWLQEGFASYSEALFVEYSHSRHEGLMYLYDEHYSYMLNRRSVLGPDGVHYFPSGETDVYSKGAATLDALRLAISNDSIFFDILKTFATRYKKSIINTDDFIKLVEEKTGKDYMPLFHAYLMQRKPPKLVVKPDNKSKTVTVFWRRVPDGFELPVYFYNSTEDKLSSIRATDRKIAYNYELLPQNSVFNAIGYYRLKPLKYSYLRRGK